MIAVLKPMHSKGNRLAVDRLQKIGSATLVLLLALIVTASAQAAPADFDPSFGTGGLVLTPFGTAGDSANDVVIQPDGKIVVAVRSIDLSNISHWMVARYNADGSLDTGFSGDGKQSTSFGGPFDSYAQSIALQSDGKIVVGGSHYNGLDWDFAVARYLDNGTPDVSFSGDGIQTTALTGTDFGSSVAIQPDNKIVLAGDSYLSGQKEIAAVRYDVNGVPDTTFSGDGIQKTPIGAGDTLGRAVEIQADNKIVIAGLSDSVTAPQFAAIRYDTGGTLDPSYSGDGKVVLSMAGTDQWVNDAALQPDGKLVIAGSSSQLTDENFALARINTDGTPDTSFGASGVVDTTIGSLGEAAGALAIQTDGKIVTAGYTYNTGIPQFRWAVTRYNADGSLDTGFGNGGRLIPTVGTGDESVGAVAMQTDGKIIIAGSGKNATDTDVAIVRLLGVTPPPPVPLSASINKKLRGKLKAKKLKSITGAAAGTGLAKIQISLNYGNKRLLKKSKKCLFVKNSKGQTKKYKAKKKRCAPVKWLTVKGTTNWSYKLKRKLKPGSYTLFVRAVGADGSTQTTFSSKLGNKRSFKLTK